MFQNFTAKYTKIDSGYMGQIVEWPEVVTEGATLDDCREMLKDAIKEMLAAYAGLGKKAPGQACLFENIPVEV